MEDDIIDMVDCDNFSYFLFRSSSHLSWPFLCSFNYLLVGSIVLKIVNGSSLGGSHCCKIMPLNFILFSTIMNRLYGNGNFVVRNRKSRLIIASFVFLFCYFLLNSFWCFVGHLLLRNIWIYAFHSNNENLENMLILSKVSFGS